MIMPTGLFLVFYQRVLSRLKSIYRLRFDMTRLFYDFPLTVGTSIDLPKDIARHIMVLRLSTGDGITFFNGKGGEYQARIVGAERQLIRAEIVSFSQREIELPYKITLAQGIPEAGKMDWIIEKAVELGVQEIIPVATRRSVVRLNADRIEKRLSRWQLIVVSASQQPSVKYCTTSRFRRLHTNLFQVANRHVQPPCPRIPCILDNQTGTSRYSIADRSGRWLFAGRGGTGTSKRCHFPINGPPNTENRNGRSCRRFRHQRFLGTITLTSL